MVSPVLARKSYSLSPAPRRVFSRIGVSNHIAPVRGRREWNDVACGIPTQCCAAPPSAKCHDPAATPHSSSGTSASGSGRSRPTPSPQGRRTTSPGSVSSAVQLEDAEACKFVCYPRRILNSAVRRSVTDQPLAGFC